MFAITGQPDLPKPSLDNMTNYREVHGDPISEDCMGRVKEMIQLCDQCHPQCRSSVTTSRPRRVINVGTSQTAIQGCTYRKVKLRITLPWATAGRSWGSDNNLTSVTTECATLVERLQGIILPKTSQCFPGGSAKFRVRAWFLWTINAMILARKSAIHGV